MSWLELIPRIPHPWPLRRGVDSSPPPQPWPSAPPLLSNGSPPMPKRDKSPNADLFKLHDRFCAAYRKMKKCGVALRRDEGSLSTATKAQKKIHRKWESVGDIAFEKARAVIEAPAYTLEGMLLKLHVAGFSIISTKPDTFTGPEYRSGTRLWEPGKLANDSDELAIILSLREDLHRFAGKRV
jgi:hypothetical protein